MSATPKNRTTKEMTTFTFTRETLENGKVYFDEFNSLCKDGVLDLEAIADQECYRLGNAGYMSYEEASEYFNDEDYINNKEDYHPAIQKLESFGEGVCTWTNDYEYELFTDEELANLKRVCFDGDSYEVVELDSDNIEEVLKYVNEEIREYDDQVRFLDMIWGSYDDLARYSNETRRWKPVQYLEVL